jgi:hypothetical protein
VSTDLTPVIAASANWLLAAYPPSEGALSKALAEAQARQAATLAATLLYPTDLDVQLLHLLGPSGSHRLDWLTGCDLEADDAAWRTWVDEAVVSWAACLLADTLLSARAIEQVRSGSDPRHVGHLGRLTDPGPRDTEAAALLRHPDLLDAVATLHRPRLFGLLKIDGG